MTTPIAILLSGRGSNMLALVDAVAVGQVPARVALVVSDVETAPGLALARERGVPALAIPSRGRPREEFEAELDAALASCGAELICLAGFMRILSPWFVHRWPHRILNIHPSLLPAFPGRGAVAQAIAAGARESGCTVHVVTPRVDAGPVVLRRVVPIAPGDTEHTLAARILAEEHLAYPEALRLVLAPRAADKPRDECGIFGILAHPEAVAHTVLGLHALQHRGQEAAGVVATDGVQWTAHRGPGLVSDVFTASTQPQVVGHSAIGHVRYGTAGSGHAANFQPMIAHTALGPVAVAHNGNITNAQTLRQRLLAEGRTFQSTSDTEVILHLLCLSQKEHIVARLCEALQQVEGAYSLALLTHDAVIGVRDPAGVRPLVIGRLDGRLLVASESCALDMINAELVRDVKPGEVVVLRASGLESHPLPPAAPSRFCVFEYIYFMRPNTQHAGQWVSAVRERLGAELFRESHTPADVVIPVPDSGIHAALGYAEAAAMAHKQGIIRNHSVGRTFIEPAEGIRHFGVRLKLAVNPACVLGHRVILVDDSIVRANTMPQIVDMLRRAGARQVHVRIASPPFAHPCYYGIDTPNRAELFAAHRSVDQMRDIIGADSLAFISVEGLRRAVAMGHPMGDHPMGDHRGGDHGLCDACFTGHYPLALTDKDNGFPVGRGTR